MTRVTITATLLAASIILSIPAYSLATDSPWITATDNYDRAYFGLVQYSSDDISYSNHGPGWCYHSGNPGNDTNFVGENHVDGYYDRYLFSAGDGDDDITFADDAESVGYHYCGTKAIGGRTVYVRVNTMMGGYASYFPLIYGDDGEDTIYCCEDSSCDYHWNNCILDGRANDDIVVGGPHNDDIYGGTENDYCYGLGGHDHIEGWTGNDYLYGGDDNDYVQGQDGDDYLNGGDGDDCLLGGIGDDDLYGDEFYGPVAPTCNYLDGGSHTLGDYCKCGYSSVPAKVGCESYSNCSDGSCSGLCS